MQAPQRFPFSERVVEQSPAVVWSGRKVMEDIPQCRVVEHVECFHSAFVRLRSPTRVSTLPSSPDVQTDESISELYKQLAGEFFISNDQL
ncbi:hypothetical protein B0G83_11861 [Paraburkholderia sp. BL21I4N1]|nr:hypothetical protein B0G83_11861 [Paraburkholderia sp. BL21I4N1]